MLSPTFRATSQEMITINSTRYRIAIPNSHAMFYGNLYLSRYFSVHLTHACRHTPNPVRVTPVTSFEDLYDDFPITHNSNPYEILIVDLSVAGFGIKDLNLNLGFCIYVATLVLPIKLIPT